MNIAQRPVIFGMEQQIDVVNCFCYIFYLRRTSLDLQRPTRCSGAIASRHVPNLMRLRERNTDNSVSHFIHPGDPRV